MATSASPLNFTVLQLVGMEASRKFSSDWLYSVRDPVYDPVPAVQDDVVECQAFCCLPLIIIINVLSFGENQHSIQVFLEVSQILLYCF